MKEFVNVIKTIFVAVTTYLSVKLGILAPLLSLLFFAMLIDYVSGMAAAAKNGVLNSRVGIQGIFKKLGYAAAIAVALIVDQLLIYAVNQIGINFSFIASFGILTTIWLTLNELLSIIENLGRLDVPLPKFLIKIVLLLKDTVDEKGSTPESDLKVDDQK